MFRDRGYDLRSELEHRGLQRSKSDADRHFDLREKLNRDRYYDRGHHDDGRQEDFRHDKRQQGQGDRYSWAQSQFYFVRVHAKQVGNRVCGVEKTFFNGILPII